MKKYISLLLLTLAFSQLGIAQFENASPNEKLLMAIVNGNIEEVKDAIKNGADVNPKNSDKALPLILAVQGTVVNGTPLDISEIVKLLLDKGANVNAKDNDGNTALFLLCSGESAILSKQQKINLAELLINKGANKEVIAHTNPNDEGTPLMYACMLGDIEMVKLLINKGANVNAKNENGNTPLMFVANEKNQLPVYNRVKVIELLLAKGANPNQKNQGGESAIKMAEETSQADVVKALKGQKVLVKEPTLVKTDIEGLTLPLTVVLMPAIMEGNTDGVKEALKNGADLNIHTDFGSPLSAACSNLCSKNNYEIVELLIANGADVNYPVNFGGFNGALGYATFAATSLYFQKKYQQQDVRDHNEFIKIMELLLKKGAKPDGVQFNEEDITPLMVAAGAGCLEAVQLLLKNGALAKEPPQFTKGYEMGLMNLAAGGPVAWTSAFMHGAAKSPLLSNESVKQNVKAWDEIKKSYHEQRPSLFDEYTEIVRLLISKGVSVNVKCKGITPLAQAQDLNITPMINLLKKAGAK